MLGLKSKHDTSVDPTRLPVLVHALYSTEAFNLAQKIWENNARYALVDATNRKELLRFVFAQPACVVWLQRDQGRADTFELILMWDEAGKEHDVTEVYVLSATTNVPVGDDSRAKSLLNAILASPSTVPVDQKQKNERSGPDRAQA